jgi:lysophospholipase L1-like esterase
MLLLFTKNQSFIDDDSALTKPVGVNPDKTLTQLPTKLFYCLVLTLLASIAHAGEQFVAANHALIVYEGRWRATASGEPSAVWAGTSVQLTFDGTSVAATLTAGNKSDQFRVIVDQQARGIVRTKPGTNSYLLASDLAPGIHHIKLFKETFYAAEVIFHGFKIMDGKVLPTRHRYGGRVEFFGDSNMSGASLYSEKDGSDTGTYFAYPSMVARMLNAEPSIQARGGATLGGEGPNTVLSFIFSDNWFDSDPLYRSDFLPNVIVINAGANDIYKVDKSRQKAEVKARFKAVIKVLRDVHGGTPHIVLFNAYGWDVNEPANYTAEVIDEVGGNLSVCQFPWMWEKWHGSMVEQAGQARVLAKCIAELNLGLDIVNQGDVFNGFGESGDVANGSFEAQAVAGFHAFGWRYHDDGVSRIRDPDSAFHGEYYIQLEAGELVHQGTDATGDLLPGPANGTEQFKLDLMMRGVGNSVALIGADFEAQPMYNREHQKLTEFHVLPEWRNYEVLIEPPAGSWKSFIILKVDTGTIDIDRVRLLRIR